MNKIVQAYWRAVSRVRRFLYGDRWPSPWFRQLRITRSISEYFAYVVGELRTPADTDEYPNEARKALADPEPPKTGRQPMMWSPTMTYCDRRRKRGRRRDN